MVQIAKTGRIEAIDLARGVALMAMVIYHFRWDLEFFGWASAGANSAIGWVLFARAIAASFLFLVGIGLALAHFPAIGWPSFWKRLAMVAAAALLITVATWFAIPDSFIFFGILHAIALFSLCALPFLRLPWSASFATALLVLLLAEPLRSEIFDAPALWWLGLAPVNPVSNDYVPLFPWFSATLAGVAMGKLGLAYGWFERLSGWRPRNIPSLVLQWCGRHSLGFYLLHQPILIAALWIFTQIAGPPDRTLDFLKGCATTCTADNDALYCEAFCSCAADGLKRENLFEPFFQGQVDLNTDRTARNVIDQCSLEPNG